MACEIEKKPCMEKKKYKIEKREDYPNLKNSLISTKSTVVVYFHLKFGLTKN